MYTRLTVALVACILATGCDSSASESKTQPEPTIATVTETVTAAPTEPTTESSGPTETQAGPRVFPRRDYLVAPNENVTLDGGITARVEAPKSVVAGAETGDGESELVVTVDGSEHRAPIPAGPSPMLFDTLVDIGGEQPMFLVLQSGGDAASYAPFTLVEDELVAMAVTPGDVELTSSTSGIATWIGPDRDLVTVVSKAEGAERGQVYRWVRSPQDLATLDAEVVGERCFDWQAETVAECV